MVNAPRWVKALNDYFGDEHIVDVRVDDLPGPDVPLHKALASFGVRGHDEIELTLTSMPSSHMAALRGLLHDAVDRNLPVNFAWMPGYDHEVTISEWGHDGKPCGITVVLRGPHRGDIAARSS